MFLHHKTHHYINPTECMTSTVTLTNNNYILYCNSIECFLDTLCRTEKPSWNSNLFKQTIPCMCVCVCVMTYRDWRDWRFFRAALGTVFSWLFWSILKLKWQNEDFNTTQNTFSCIINKNNMYPYIHLMLNMLVSFLMVYTVLLLLLMWIHAGY